MSCLVLCFALFSPPRFAIVYKTIAEVTVCEKTRVQEEVREINKIEIRSVYWGSFAFHARQRDKKKISRWKEIFHRRMLCVRLGNEEKERKMENFNLRNIKIKEFALGGVSWINLFAEAAAHTTRLAPIYFHIFCCFVFFFDAFLEKIESKEKRKCLWKGSSLARHDWLCGCVCVLVRGAFCNIDFFPDGVHTVEELYKVVFLFSEKCPPCCAGSSIASHPQQPRELICPKNIRKLISL